MAAYEERLASEYFRAFRGGVMQQEADARMVVGDAPGKVPCCDRNFQTNQAFLVEEGNKKNVKLNYRETRVQQITEDLSRDLKEVA